MQTRSTAADWKLLFQTILQRDDLDLEITTDDKDDCLHVTTTDKHIAEQLNANLNSPETIRTSLNYTLAANKTDLEISTLPKVTYPEAIDLEHNIGVTFYDQLFGPEIIKRTGRINWNTEANIDNGFLLLARCEPPFEEELTAPQIKTYQRFLSNATFAELRTALAKDSALQKPLPPVTGKKGVLAEHADKIIYLDSEKKIIYFDFGLLIKCLTPPVLKVNESQQDDIITYSFDIDKNHWANYFSNIFPEGFVLHLKANQATPICFNVGRHVPLRTSVSLLLDCSGSMYKSFPNYIVILNKFIADMLKDKNFADAKIRITPFASTKAETKIFYLATPTVLADVNEYLATLKAEGSTYLKGTLLEELQYISSNMPNQNNSVVLFTDGQDDPPAAVNRDEIDSKLKAITASVDNHKIPPKIFTYALGADYDKDLLEKLALLSGCAHTQLKSIDDFNTILKDIGQIGRFRALAKFMQQMTQFVVPVYDKSLCVAQETLTVPGEFMAGGKQYFVKPGGLQLSAEEKAETVSQPQPTKEDVVYQQLRALMKQSGVSEAGFFAKFIDSTRTTEPAPADVNKTMMNP